MDEADFAQVASDFYLAGALAEHFARSVAKGASRMECIDCEEEIPEARREAVPGCTRCVECQEGAERSA